MNRHRLVLRISSLSLVGRLGWLGEGTGGRWRACCHAEAAKVRHQQRRYIRQPRCSQGLREQIEHRFATSRCACVGRKLIHSGTRAINLRESRCTAQFTSKATALTFVITEGFQNGQRGFLSSSAYNYVNMVELIALASARANE